MGENRRQRKKRRREHEEEQHEARGGEGQDTRNAKVLRNGRQKYGTKSDRQNN